MDTCSLGTALRALLVSLFFLLAACGDEGSNNGDSANNNGGNNTAEKLLFKLVPPPGHEDSVSFLFLDEEICPPGAPECLFELPEGFKGEEFNFQARCDAFILAPKPVILSPDMARDEMHEIRWEGNGDVAYNFSGFWLRSTNGGPEELVELHVILGWEGDLPRLLVQELGTVFVTETEARLEEFFPEGRHFVSLSYDLVLDTILVHKELPDGRIYDDVYTRPE